MLDYPVAIKKSVDPDLANKNLRAHHSWISPWTIHVSLGLTNVVDNLLTEIEDIMVSNRPALAFFRITEEIDGDLERAYHRKLLVFLEARQRIEARDQALLNAVQRAVGQSLMTCHACGNLLERKNLYDEGERELFPFLPVLEVKRNGYSSNSFMHVCMSCASKAWEEKQSANATESALAAAKAQADPFDMDAWEDCYDEDSMDEFGIAKSQTDDEDLVADEDLPVEDEEEAAESGPYVTMYDIAVVNKLEERSKDMSKDHAQRIKGIVKQIKETSPDKRLVTIPDAWRHYCEDLTRKFPNFVEVVDFIRNQLGLSSMSDGVLRLPPFLLVGGPGIGKTEFMLTLATDFKTKLEIIDISAAQTGSALTGSEAYWGNTRPGMLFETLAFGDIANPIVMLDELDKTRADASSYKPLAALHQLLEPRQARIFKDLSLPELVLDASNVIWMATSNTVDTLERPILDRFTIFNIADPSKEQMQVIANNQYQRFIGNHPAGHVFEETMRSEVIDELCKYHPRKVRKILEQSFGLAAYEGRTYLTVADIRASDTDNKKERHLGIGFLSSID